MEIVKKQKIINIISIVVVVIAFIVSIGSLFYAMLKKSDKELYDQRHYDKIIEVLSFELIEYNEEERTGEYYKCITNASDYPVVNVSPVNVTTYYHKTKWNLSDSLKGTITATVKRNLEGVWFLIVYVNG